MSESEGSQELKRRERAPRRVADVVAGELASAGVEWVAGHPGGEVVTLIDALHHAGVPFVLTHHETTAAFMAAGHGELTGRPGVALATLGPGATNMVTGVANAFLDRAPMIALTGSLATNSPPGKTHQDLDLTALYGPVTKASITVTVENARSAVRRALQTATAWPMGPVHLTLPSDVAATEAGRSATNQSTARDVAPALTGGSEPSNSDLERARRMLTNANRPVILCGVGTLRQDVVSSVTILARTIGAAVIVTPKAKGAYDETDPQFAGVLEAAGNDLVVGFLRRADLVLSVGLDVVELDKAWPFEGPMIAVDSRPYQEGFLEVSLELVGNQKTVINLLLESLDDADGWPLDEIGEHMEELRAYLCAVGTSLTPWETINEVWDSLGGNALVTSDTGAHKFLVSQLWKTREPQTFFVSNGLSSMGYAIPTAMAACMQNSTLPVVAFVGDGGVNMFLGELATIHRLQLRMVIVLFVDGSLELIRRSQADRGLVEDGTRFDNPDYLQIAAGFALKGYSAANVEELRDALREAKGPGAHLIAVTINGSDYRL